MWHERLFDFVKSSTYLRFPIISHQTNPLPKDSIRFAIDWITITHSPSGGNMISDGHPQNLLALALCFFTARLTLVQVACLANHCGGSNGFSTSWTSESRMCACLRIYERNYNIYNPKSEKWLWGWVERATKRPCSGRFARFTRIINFLPGFSPRQKSPTSYSRTSFEP